MRSSSVLEMASNPPRPPPEDIRSASAPTGSVRFIGFRWRGGGVGSSTLLSGAENPLNAHAFRLGLARNYLQVGERLDTVLANFPNDTILADAAAFLIAPLAPDPSDASPPSFFRHETDRAGRQMIGLLCRYGEPVPVPRGHALSSHSPQPNARRTSRTRACKLPSAPSLRQPPKASPRTRPGLATLVLEPKRPARPVALRSRTQDRGLVCRSSRMDSRRPSPLMWIECCGGSTSATPRPPSAPTLRRTLGRARGYANNTCSVHPNVDRQRSRKVCAKLLPVLASTGGPDAKRGGRYPYPQSTRRPRNDANGPVPPRPEAGGFVAGFVALQSQRWLCSRASPASQIPSRKIGTSFYTDPKP